MIVLSPQKSISHKSNQYILIISTKAEEPFDIEKKQCNFYTVVTSESLDSWDVVGLYIFLEQKWLKTSIAGSCGIFLKPGVVHIKFVNY